MAALALLWLWDMPCTTALNKKTNKKNDVLFMCEVTLIIPRVSSGIGDDGLNESEVGGGPSAPPSRLARFESKAEYHLTCNTIPSLRVALVTRNV